MGLKGLLPLPIYLARFLPIVMQRDALPYHILNADQHHQDKGIGGHHLCI